MQNPIKAGLLPLYIELYDKVDPTSRQPMEQYLEEAAAMLRKNNIELVVADVCRIKPEFEKAADMFKSAKIDVLITFHLAYSPSLESIDALKKLNVPIVVLDSTPCYDFTGAMNQKDEIMANHGIHGVQDMCNLLKRNHIPYCVEAGHIHHSDVISRVTTSCKAAKAANAYKNARIGIVGKPFKGMGDFFKTPQELKQEIGASVISLDMKKYKAFESDVTETELEAELKYDKKRFDMQIENLENYTAATRTGLAIRKWVKSENITALTVNFLDTGTGGMPKMPFASLCKEMMNGIGYAGEGDTLTAGLVGALQSVYPQTSFTEMFCPCWKSGEIFLSHMGEMNLNLAVRKPVMFDSPFSYTDAGDTVKIAACFKQGDAVFVNLAPMAEGYLLITAPVEMIDHFDGESVYNRTIRGWMKPELPIDEFLSVYSNAGGTHHGALVYNVHPKELKLFADFMGFEFLVIS